MASQKALETKIDTLGAELGILKDDHRRLAKRVTTDEKMITELPDDMTTLRKCLANMKGKVQVLEVRAKGAENRSRRSNIHVLGMPEKIEGMDMRSYLVTWLREEVAPTGLSPSMP
ncbi:hypothetical protein NDU88_009170 [Pleurodeles waltl]|uniref:Uncharacterized protein n=1 Tax=Pleurodeles waltl TaxID=8319 RepID=A0AAV7RVC7_PLEWA|nr:hypothetical protein NDU88_009170 [Pleurodeles waltl]